MKVIAAYTIKGGVGKTSAAVNLAWHAARTHRTLLWDLDPQGAATYVLEVKAKLKGGAKALVRGEHDAIDAIRPTGYPGLDVLPSDLSYRDLVLALDGAKKSTRRLEKVLDPLRGVYDVVVLDCPPGASLLSENILTAADALLVPLVPSPLSMRTLEQVTDLVVSTERKPPKILGFLSMVDRRKTVHRELVDALPRERPHVLPVVVPYAAVVERMGTERAPLGVYASRSEAALAYEELWTQVAAALGVALPDHAAGAGAPPRATMPS